MAINLAEIMEEIEKISGMNENSSKSKSKEQTEDSSNRKSGFVNGNKLALDDEGESKLLEPQKKSEDKLTIMVIFSIFLTINIIAILLFAYDIGGIRTKFMNTNDQSSTTVADNALKIRLEDERKALEDEKAQFEEEKKSLQEAKDAATKKEEELKQLQVDIENKQKAQEEVKAVIATTPTSNPNGQSIADTVKIYENMEAKDAAKILTAMDLPQKVAIIKNMKKDKAAEVLAVMDAAQSSSIMKELMK